jgi:GNAT superfamily N-acetyltransferase
LTSELALESRRIYSGVWSDFIRGSKGGEVFSIEGVTVAANRSSWPGLNLAFFDWNEVSLDNETEWKVRAINDYFRSIQRSWLLVMPLDTAQQTGQAAQLQLLGDMGLFPVQELVGMWTDSLLPAARAVPDLTFCPVADANTEQVFAGLNAGANQIPEEWTFDAIVGNRLWGNQMSGMIGYRGSNAVTGSMICRWQGIDLVGWVATLPDHQHCGYAEAVLRRTVSEAHARQPRARLHLHSTAAGLSLYRRLGFTECARFQLFLAGP